MGIHSVSLVRHWENKICQCLLPVGLLCAKLANKCHFTKDIWNCKLISALAQMLIDLNEECEGWGLQRLLCLLSFSSGMKCKFLLVWVSLKSPWLYHVNSSGFKACVKKSLFFHYKIIWSCLPLWQRWMETTPRPAHLCCVQVSLKLGKNTQLISKHHF